MQAMLCMNRRQVLPMMMLVLACLLSFSLLPTKSDVQAKRESSAGVDPLQTVREICAGKDEVEVGIEEKPLVLPCPAKDAGGEEWRKFLDLYLTYATSEQYNRVTGEEPVREVWSSREAVMPAKVPDVWEQIETQAELKLQVQAELGMESPPEEVDWREYFPPAGLQKWEDCGAWSASYAQTAAQARQFAETWPRDPWEPEGIGSPLWISSLSARESCRVAALAAFGHLYDHGLLTQDRLPYGDGDCHRFEPSAADYEAAYPMRVAEESEKLFWNSTLGGEPVSGGSLEAVREAVASGWLVKLSFSPQDGSMGGHGVAVGGYNQDGVHLINSWGADWGLEDNGWFFLTWEQVEGEEEVGEPLFSTPKLIYTGIMGAVDWEGECTYEYVLQDYRTVCEELEADLSVSKEDSADPVLAGGLFSYTVWIENMGPDAAVGVVMTDTLPLEMKLVNAEPDHGMCDGLLCHLRDIAAGDRVKVIITARAAAEAGHYTNTVEVSSSTEDPDESNNNTSEATEVLTRADLSVSKEDSADPVLAGGLFSYTVWIENMGPGAAVGVVMTDSLPEGMSLVNVEAGQGTCSSAVCELETIPSGESVEVVLTVEAPVEEDVYTNTVEVTASTADPDESNNRAAEETTVVGVADLWVTKQSTADTVVVGEVLTYSISVGNHGPSTSTEVVVTDTLPSGMELVSAEPGQGECTDLVCNLGDIAAYSEVEVVITAEASEVGEQVNRAEAASDTEDPDPSNNSDEASVDVVALPEADLSVTKESSTSTVLIGNAVTYTVTVTNDGPDEAEEVVMTDTLPSGMELMSAEPGQGECTGTICELGDIPNGGSVEIIITAEASEVGEQVNLAEATSDTKDPDPSNNSASGETTVTSVADIWVTKRVAPKPVKAGELLTYTITVGNDGPSTATKVVVTDTLPLEMTLLSAEPSQGTCTDAVCSMGDLPAGVSVPITLTVIAPSSAGVYTNTVKIGSQTTDPDIEDTQDCESVQVEMYNCYLPVVLRSTR